LPNDVREQITSECRRQFPNLIGDYLKRQDCVERLERERREALREQQRAEERRRREEAARPCIATALPSIETSLIRARNSISQSMTLDEVKTELDRIFDRPGEIVASSNNIFDKVYVNGIYPRCDTEINFLVNVDANCDRQLTRYAVWSNNPPRGYASGFRDDLWRDIAMERQQEQERIRAAQAAEQERQWQAQLAEQQRQRQIEMQQRVAAARNQIVITSRNIECPYSTMTRCEGYRVTVSVRNNSRETVRSLKFGFTIMPEDETTCPSSLSPRVTRQFTLSPGETASYVWDAYGAGMPAPPATRQFRYCVTIAEIELI
jgi:hypothetical protein